MADLEDVTLDGRPLHSLRVADLKAALEERGLPKSGQKNALIKRLKGALMLENLQRTSTPHIGLQPNSRIGEEMSQNSFIKQYLAKQQELLRQRLEREAREAAETDGTDQEDHTEANDSTISPAPNQDAEPSLVDQHKHLTTASEGDELRKEKEMLGQPSHSAPAPPAGIASLSVRVVGERGPTSSHVPVDSDDDSDGVDDNDDEDEEWNMNARSCHAELLKSQPVRERSGGSQQQQQPPPQHIPLLSQQLRQPTPPPSPPPELSFPLPDTPKQSPPSPGEPPSRQRMSSSSSSGSSSSDSRSSSPEPAGDSTGRKPGPLTLLARKMESEGAFSGTVKREREGVDGQAGRGHQEASVSAVTHTANVATVMTYPGSVISKQGIKGAFPHCQAPVSVVRTAVMEESDATKQEQEKRERQREQERLKALEKERKEREKALEEQKAQVQERRESEEALEREREERERALQREREEREKALEQERLEREKALERERELERERLEREQALERERQDKERLERERQEREQALERERLEKERQEKERLEREQALERERLEKERLEKDRLEREQALERERLEKEREQALERERLERERQEKERLEREQALEKERLERERQEKERLEREQALERERQEKERLEREEALEKERLEKERQEREKALEEERLEKERQEREKALEKEKQEREHALERERLEKEKEREQALERERLEKEKKEREHVLERERLEKERQEREQALERERLEKERQEREQALERERLEKERQEREQALEKERLEREAALERKRQEMEKAKEQERLEREKALEKERQEREIALKRERQEKERQESDRLEKEKALEQERLQREQAQEHEREAQKKAEEEKKRVLEKEREEKEKALIEEKQRALGEKKRLLEQQRVQEEKEKALKHDKEEEREKERESRLPPWKRGLSHSIAHPLESPSSEKPNENKAEESQSVSKDARSTEPVPQKPPMLLSPQSSSKKSRFLRDTPLPSSPTSVLKRPCIFSDSPTSQGPSITLASKPGKPVKDDIAQAPQKSPPTVRQGVLVSAPQELESKTPKLAAQDQEEEKTVVSESCKVPKYNAASQDTKCQTLRRVEDQGKPPSFPPKEKKRERDKEVEKRGRKSSSSSSDSSSSDSDSGSSSSSRSSSSSSSSQEKTCSTSGGRRSKEIQKDNSSQRTEKVGQTVVVTGKSAISQRKKLGFTEQEEKEINNEDAIQTKEPCLELQDGKKEKRGRKEDIEEDDTNKDTMSTEVKEAVMAEPEKVPESSEESTTPKVFSARKILLGSSKSSPGVVGLEGEAENAGGAGAGRKRRWGASTAVTAKKPSISITTDSLKSLIPDIKPSLGQEAVLDLHPEEMHLSGEEGGGERGDQDLKIRRTVTQVVPSDTQENGQKESKRSEPEDEAERSEGRDRLGQEEKMEGSIQISMETEPSSPGHDVDMKTVTPSDTLIRRSISQQKSGVSITIDDPVRTAKQPSPPRSKLSNIIHVCNLVRPFTLGQLKELLNRTGTVVDESFWIDKIKSHCYVTYSSAEEAMATRTALHGVKWPQSNPKFLSVDFCTQEELDFHRGLGPAGEKPVEEVRGAAAAGPGRAVPPPLLPERDQWAEREREMERRERARAEREWDRDKVRDFSKPGEEREAGARRSRSRDRERRRKDRGKSKERKPDKKEKGPEEPPAKLLDDLFRKTKAAPCIYWLPLTEEQAAQRVAARAERMREREKRRKEMEEEEDKKREEERRERMKTSGGAGGENERERDRERDRGREREREGGKRKETYRRPVGNSASGSRRSHSRSDPPPRDRRR
ncbi:apoptotic chromatin condensation inducer in the nucleus-like isoform X2 [Myxocyprinus asiaticus]|uniref:apoptotic chromatin condensation inducer in the nucleus-like isoform X2 n=1 Tax=Myxocyprinus asiaticus TaxID=70543 RepID=UPI002222D22F|nr:apoptotic chromatin condensation inducer in the nucleus-like isoform X2 [Myxocyprinus asiaticus]